MKKILLFVFLLLAVAGAMLILRSWTKRESFVTVANEFLPSIPWQTPERIKKKLQAWKPTNEEIAIRDSTEAVLYGRVVDEAGAPVAGAEVACVLNTQPNTYSTKGIVLTSDSKGNFFTAQPNSPWMKVKVTCAGYYSTPQSYADLVFFDPPASTPDELRKVFQPKSVTTADSPHLFILKKMNSRDPLLRRTVGHRLKSQQMYLIGQNSKQTLAIRYRLDPDSKIVEPAGRERFDWSAEIKVVDGELIKAQNNNEYDSVNFVAPESGYQPEFKYSFQASQDQSEYKTGVNDQFHLRFSDGTYARVSVQLSLDPEGPFGSISSYFNPSGGRSTEYDRTVEIEISPTEDKEKMGYE